MARAFWQTSVVPESGMVKTAVPDPADVVPAATKTEPPPAEPANAGVAAAGPVPPAALREVGGPGGPEPTRFGDWERGGRCIDF